MKMNRKKVPKEAIKSKLAQNTKTTRLYQKIKESQQSKITKFFAYHRRGTLYCSILLVLCGAIGGVYYVYQMQSEQTQRMINEEASTPISTTSSNYKADATSGPGLDTASSPGLNIGSTSGSGLGTGATSGQGLNADTTSGPDIKTETTSDGT